MALERDFAELCFDTVTIEPVASADGYSKPAYGAAVTYTDVRVESYNKMVRARDGQERIASTICYFMTPPTNLTERSRVTLPGGRQPRIIRIDNLPDTSDNYYTALYLGDIMQKPSL